jgi:hypothetical protein
VRAARPVLSGGQMILTRRSWFSSVPAFLAGFTLLKPTITQAATTEAWSVHAYRVSHPQLPCPQLRLEVFSRELLREGRNYGGAANLDGGAATSDKVKNLAESLVKLMREEHRTCANWDVLKGKVIGALEGAAQTGKSVRVQA